MYVIVIQIAPITDQDISTAIDRVLLTEGCLDADMLCTLVASELGCAKTFALSEKILALSLARITSMFRATTNPLPSAYGMSL